MKAQEYRNKVKEIDNQLVRLSKESRSRLLKLCKANPDVILYQYQLTPTEAGIAYAKYVTKESIKYIEGSSVLDYMEVIEKHIENNNPRKQLELDLKDPK